MRKQIQNDGGMEKEVKMRQAEEKAATTVYHEFGPFYNVESRVLILGTIPSPKSREQGFYYGHPRNRFWKVLAQVFGETEPKSVDEKKALALRHHVALWDVLASCTIRGAEDASIRDAVPNDLNVILSRADIRGIFATGKKAAALYRKYCQAKTKRACVCLPSTSPANCAVHDEELLQAYKAIRQCVEDGRSV